MEPFTLGWLQLAAVVGSLQGLLLTGALLAQRNNRTANRLLAALMAMFTIYLASSAYYATGLFQRYPHFFGVAYLGPWVFGPLVYLYAVAASDRAWRFRRRHLLHFLPVGVVIASVMPFFMLSGVEKVAMIDRMIAGEMPTMLVILTPTKFISGIAYSIATILYLRAHQRTIEEGYSNTERVNLRWLLWFGAAAAGIWILATTLEVADFGQRLRDDHISLAIAVLIYAIGYMGLRQPEIFRYRTAEFPIVTSASVRPVENVAEAADTPTTRYERSGLSAEEATVLERELKQVMETARPWKDSELTLPDLAERLGSTPHKLSEVLNTQVGQTFYDFVNGYRVREVQRRIEAGEARRLKMLALAMDAGFASKSTFNQVFKKHTALTPSDFRSRAEANV